MEKVKYLPLSLFIAFSIKMLVLPFAITEVAALLVIGAAAFLYEQKSDSKQNKILCDKIDKNDQLIKEMKQELESTKAAIVGVKLGSISGIKRS